MKERKNIDRLFQEKFKDFDAAPQEYMWNRIEAELNQKKKRRIIPFWLQMTGIAAALLIGLFIAVKLLNLGNTPETKVVYDQSHPQKSDSEKVGNNPSGENTLKSAPTILPDTENDENQNSDVVTIGNDNNAQNNVAPS